MNTSAVNLPSPKVPSFSQTFTSALPPVPRFASPPLPPAVPSIVVPVRTPLEIGTPQVVPPKTIQNWLRNNMGKVVAICLVLLITIILIARLVLMQRKNKKQREEELKTVETDPEWESFFNGNIPPVQEPPSPPQSPIYQPPAQSSPLYHQQQQKQHQAFYEQNRAPQQHPLHLQQQQPVHSQLPQPVMVKQAPPLQQQTQHQPSRANPGNDEATKTREDSNNRAGGRGIQNRFAPAENMHGGAGMPHSMMPESTRPIRETSSDSTFKVKPEDLVISPPAEAEASSVASAKAPESSSS